MCSTDRDWFAAGLRFACQACGSCCRGQDDRDTVFIGSAEEDAIAGWLGLERRRFRARYTRRTGAGELTLVDRGDACIFLENRRCVIYPVRPLQCRTWPFWPENIADQAAWLEAARDCPGIDQGDLHAASVVRGIAAVLARADRGEVVTAAEIPSQSSSPEMPVMSEETSWGE